jgi:hypothetical protein
VCAKLDLSVKTERRVEKKGGERERERDFEVIMMKQLR